MKKVESGGIEIAYAEAGTGEPALVLIHAPLGNRGQVAALFEHQAAKRRVLAPDLRGTGESGVPAQGYRVCDLAEDVIAVCRAAGVRKAVFCGHSLGGSTAVEVAARAPELVAGVALLDAVVLFPEPVRRQALDGLVPALEGPGRMEALLGYVAGRMFAPTDPPDVKARVMSELSLLPAQLPAQLIRDGMSRDYSEQIAAGTYPLLYIHAMVPADLARLKQLRPDAIVASVAGSGHYMAVIVPDQVNAMLDRFIDMVASPPEPAATQR